MPFATKPQIALQQLRTLLDEGAPRHCVLAHQRLVADKPVDGKKNFIERHVPALLEDYIPAAALRAQRDVAASITSLRNGSITS